MQYLERKSNKRSYDKDRPRPRKQPASSGGGEYGAEVDYSYVDAVSNSDIQLKLREFHVK